MLLNEYSIMRRLINIGDAFSEKLDIRATGGVKILIFLKVVFISSAKVAPPDNNSK